tara:strand:+ start:37020 stop:37868 length:849 start_codon:yes stop_codon:yes gene_type:complete
MLDVVLIIITFIVLLIASYTDLKTREVPDWISYGLIFMAFGVRIIFSFELGINVIVSGVLGFVVCLGIAFLFYYAGQWGGGDSKLLMGMGAVIGITYPLALSSLALLWYFLALLFFGAIYGLLWMAWLAVRNRRKFVPTYLGKLEKNKQIHYLIIAVTLGMLISAFYIPKMWVFAFLPVVLFYLLTFVSVVEEKCFVKRIEANKLTEGDWLEKDVVVSGKRIVKKKTLHAEDLDKIMALYDRGKISHVVIKEGIPFIPSFLFGYIVLVFGKINVEMIFSLFV